MRVTEPTEVTESTETAPRQRRRYRRWVVGVVLLAVAATVAVLWLTVGSGYVWSRSFRSEVKACDELVVRTGGLCHRRRDEEKVIANVTGAAEVGRLAADLCARFPNTAWSCMCCGDITLEFYAAGELHVAVSVHHGKRLRWPGHGSGDAALSGRGREIVGPWVTEANELAKARLEAQRSANSAALAKDGAEQHVAEGAGGTQGGRAEGE